MDHRTEDRLQTIAAALENAQRAVLQIAIKGEVTSGTHDRLTSMLRIAAEAAAKLATKED